MLCRQAHHRHTAPPPQQAHVLLHPPAELFRPQHSAFCAHRCICPSGRSLWAHITCGADHDSHSHPLGLQGRFTAAAATQGLKLCIWDMLEEGNVYRQAFE
jgi:hypothetical protein